MQVKEMRVYTRRNTSTANPSLPNILPNSGKPSIPFVDDSSLPIAIHKAKGRVL